MSILNLERNNAKSVNVTLLKKNKDVWKMKEQRGHCLVIRKSIQFTALTKRQSTRMSLIGMNQNKLETFGG